MQFGKTFLLKGNHIYIRNNFAHFWMRWERRTVFGRDRRYKYIGGYSKNSMSKTISVLGFSRIKLIIIIKKIAG